MCIHNVKGIQRILRKRLPYIDRWKSVSVYRYDDNKLPWFISPTEGMFYVLWNRPKRKNIHEDEYREIPLADLDIVFERNRTRLYNKTKAYK